MYEYLEEHAYISKNKKSNYQFELTKERAECIANKYNSLVGEKDKEIECLNHKLNMIKNNVQILTPDKILEIIETYTGFFGKEIKGGLYEEII